VRPYFFPLFCLPFSFLFPLSLDSWSDVLPGLPAVQQQNGDPRARKARRDPQMTQVFFSHPTAPVTRSFHFHLTRPLSVSCCSLRYSFTSFPFHEPFRPRTSTGRPRNPPRYESSLRSVECNNSFSQPPHFFFLEPPFQLHLCCPDKCTKFFLRLSFTKKGFLRSQKPMPFPHYEECNQPGFPVHTPQLSNEVETHFLFLYSRSQLDP